MAGGKALMFKSFYGFSFNPFDKHFLSEKDAFISRDHKEMTTRLSYLSEIRGIGIFTAPPGFGKTFSLRCFSKDLNPNLFQMEYISLSTVSVNEFYRQFCTVLGVDASSRKTAMFKAIQDRLYHLYKEKRRPLILAVDEAQELETRIFKDIKMIMNHGYDALNCFTLVLIGEPHLNHILEKPVHEALRQRITVHYSYRGLGDDEVPEYIFHKFRAAGAATSILGDGVIPAVHGYARGNPRLIDNLMAAILTIGAQNDKKVIDSDTILAAVNSQSLH
jgi:type II secretory pathway predicted ATPase ExeA